MWAFHGSAEGDQGTNMSRFLKTIAVLMFAGVILIMYLLGTNVPTARESSLLSIIMFMLSTLATWILSHFYAETTHKQAIEEVKNLYQSNLRTYALKASEKVNNLSKQLSLLGVYLQQELDATDYDSPGDELLVKEERIGAAIQMVNVLKSVNDTGLSDWQGVIGSELDQQRKERDERLQDLNKLVEQYLVLQHENIPSKKEDTGKLNSEIQSLKEQLSALSAGIIGSPIHLTRRTKQARQSIENPCPACRCAQRLGSYHGHPGHARARTGCPWNNSGVIAIPVVSNTIHPGHSHPLPGRPKPILPNAANRRPENPLDATVRPVGQ
jgi:hypothetical protein